MDQDATLPLGTEVGLGPGHIVLDGDSSPQKGYSSPQFSAHVYCGQTAGWIKMPLGMEVRLGPGDIALDGDPAPPRKGIQQPPQQSPLFGLCLLWPKGRRSQLLLRSCKNSNFKAEWSGTCMMVCRLSVRRAMLDCSLMSLSIILSLLDCCTDSAATKSLLSDASLSRSVAFSWTSSRIYTHSRKVAPWRSGNIVGRINQSINQHKFL